MTSRQDRKRVRKAPEERRQEIVAAAARIGLTEGLERITLRRVADDLGVRSGLVGHYFPTAEDLVTEAFTSAAAGELDALLPETAGDRSRGSAVRVLQNFLARLSGPVFDDVSRLWLNARHLSRYRPVLNEGVVRQELLWCRRVEQVIAAGVAQGSFRCEDPWEAAVRVIAVLDGVNSYTNTSAQQRSAPLIDMVRTFTEAELGLPRDALLPHGPAADGSDREPRPADR
ncbi:TetR/AcrR family transcriptional regulator [Nocardiopsis ganjiahuensis]|uniref:TetR/AcrR family transcriptional regulator n=1 Tax=Nocardiopsis ganjiahuensis TaxID=239984 RepID=UPI00068797B8|nr:TetR family transcriptional regulator C-terminal domain-containing protein [Nocardiopsis ganjiahuensis]